EDDYTRVNGIKGIENSYQELLETRTNGKKQAERDVNNYLIMNKASTFLPTQDGPNLILNIPIELQRRTEHMLSMSKKAYNAKEILCAIMDSKTGKLLVLATSNRFDPKAIRKSDYASLNANAIEYTFEPGSVIKPLVFAKLLEKKKITTQDIINTHNGRYKMGNNIITDAHKSRYLSAENVIVHSSNIGMAQMVQKLGAIELRQGLLDFGLTQLSHLDLPYEKKGSLPSVSKLSNKVYKATTSYGYGLLVNFMQLLKAYNVFNNNGDMVRPRIVSFLQKNGTKAALSQNLVESALEPEIAQRMKKILIKAVVEGTGIAASFPGLEIGGKTGTAHIAENGTYVKKYNSSFFGFANDKKNRYTLGVTVIEPNEHVYFAATSAVPIFKKLTELLIEFEYLKPQ
ncbi:MAG: penicillin-binding transpeptidase domain-containing protein, partial [Thiovulaceae bacterium]|nr:penicillin-binding transpeptidase domain-containing protein [Sulfurimonadaceae bacterium]